MTKIGPGKYYFGEDIPLGRYNLKGVSGYGTLEFQVDETGKTDWVDFDPEGGYGSNTYNGLSLPQGWFFKITDDLVVEIKRAQMLEID